MKKNELFSFLLVSLIFTLYIFFQAKYSSNLCDGTFIYPLDDTYIHLSISKNIVEHGVWGVTRHEFSSSTSSPLYTIILSAVIFIFGNIPILPLYLNYVFSILLIYFFIRNSTKFLRFSDVQPNYKNLLLITSAFILLTVLPVLALSGMEHILQIILNLSLFHTFLRFILDDNKKYDVFSISFLSFLSVAVRYEGLFIIFLMFLMLIIRKKYIPATLILISGLLPLIIYGIFSTMNGSYFLPNSIIIKGGKPKPEIFSLLMFPFKWIVQLIENLHLLSIFLILTFNIILYKRMKLSFLSNQIIISLFWILLTIIHLTFARTGWVYRYEAYLIAIGFIIIIYNFYYLIVKIRPNMKIVVIIMLLLAIPFITRAYSAFTEIGMMSKNIYEQQFQMSRFLKEYYNNATIVINDIGACTYFADVKILDLVCLGSKETLDLRLKRQFTKENIKRLAENKNPEIAIIYEDAFKEYIPDNWKKAGTWTINHNVGCAYPTVSFYSIGEPKEKLINNMMNFVEKLPKDISFDFK